VTIYYPDVSNHNGAMAIQPGTVAVCAKASEGTGFADDQYQHFKQAAAAVGALFFGYHFLHAGNGAAQAAWCYGIVGDSVPVMIDCEPTSGSTPTVQDCLDFAHEYRALGGTCTLTYLPRWYWQQLGSPSLLPVQSAGLGLVSSDYTAYSDIGPGWQPYGGVAPAIWQYTDAQAYSGQQVDFNAYQGTVGQLKALLGYGHSTIQEDDMPYVAKVSPDPAGTTPPAPGDPTGYFIVDAGDVKHIPDNATLAEFQNAFKTIAITPAMYALLTAPKTATVNLDAAAFAAALAPLLPKPQAVTKFSGTLS
jgi:lysozyme